jgi:hypothetical protein
MDLAQVEQFFKLDVITDLAFDHPFGFITKDTDVHEWLTTIKKNGTAEKLYLSISATSGSSTSQIREESPHAI